MGSDGEMNMKRNNLILDNNLREQLNKWYSCHYEGFCSNWKSKVVGHEFSSKYVGTTGSSRLCLAELRRVWSQQTSIGGRGLLYKSHASIDKWHPTNNNPQKVEDKHFGRRIHWFSDPKCFLCRWINNLLVGAGWWIESEFPTPFFSTASHCNM